MNPNSLGPEPGKFWISETVHFEWQPITFLINAHQKQAFIGFRIPFRIKAIPISEGLLYHHLGQRSSLVLALVREHFRTKIVKSVHKTLHEIPTSSGKGFLFTFTWYSSAIVAFQSANPLPDSFRIVIMAVCHFGV